MRDIRGHFWIGEQCQYCGLQRSDVASLDACSGVRHETVTEDWTPHDSNPDVLDA